MLFFGNGIEVAEFNGFNTELIRDPAHGLQPAALVIYLFLVNVNPHELDTVLTIMYLA